MGNQLEARISAIECIQEEFGYDIREIKEQLVKLTKLIKDRAEARVVQPRESSPYVPRFSPHCFPHPNPRPYIPAMNKVSNKTYRSNLCLLMHTPMTTPVDLRMSRLVNQSSSLRDLPKRQKVSKDRTRLIQFLSYTLNYSPSCWRRVLSSRFTYHRSDLHFQNGIKLTPIVIIMLETLGIHWRIVLFLSIKYKN